MIYVVAHKMYKSPQLDDVYRTIYVGNKVREEAKNKGFIVDSGGDSICEKNPYYCELTALYWIWKNDKTSDWIGLNHYRRYFVSSKTHEILEKQEIEQLLSVHDVILWKKLYLHESVERFYYRGAGYKKDILLLKKVLLDLYPDYMETCEKVLGEKSASYANMFVMHREQFDKYCEWLFKILFTMEKELDMTKYTVQEKRVYGYLGEILLNVWVEKNNLAVAYCDVINTEVCSVSWKDTVKGLARKMAKRVVYFPSGIKYKRLYRK